MQDWIERAAERIEINTGIVLAYPSTAEIIAAEHERWLCEKLNGLPMYGNDWGRIADVLGLSVDPLSGFTGRGTTT